VTVTSLVEEVARMGDSTAEAYVRLIEGRRNRQELHIGRIRGWSILCVYAQDHALQGLYCASMESDGLAVVTPPCEGRN